MTTPHDFRDVLALAIGSEYEIVGELGRGGSSVVYHARDRVLERDVAIKVIRDTQMGDAEAVTRFEREARVLARLQHPNIVILYAAKPLPGGSLALVMQHSSWRTLKTLVRDTGPLPTEMVERILRDMAAALAYLHRNQVVHRDIKPENIFVEDETGRALLTDFGIAKPGDGQASVTLTGVVIGTPAYMSPEQIDGSEVTGQSDLYSLGMVGYEMLTGRRPWEGESLYSVIFRQKTERLPALESLRPDISDRLRLAIERATEKDPADRWADADALLAHLAGSDTSPAVVPASQAVVRREATNVILLPVEESPTIDVSRALAEADISDEMFAAAAPPNRNNRWRRVGIAAAVVLMLGMGAGAVAMTIKPGQQESSPSDVAMLGSAPMSNALTTPAVSTLPDSAPTASEALPTAPVDSQEPEQTVAPAPTPTPAAAPAQRVAQATATTTAPAAPAPVLGSPVNAGAARAADSSVEVASIPAAAPRLSVVRSGAGAPTSASVERTAAPRTAAAAPRLQNRDEFVRRLQRLDPDRTRTVVLDVLVNERGAVVDSRLGVSSGLPELDQALMRASRTLRFTRSSNPNVPARVWVSIPLTFNSQN